MTTARTQIDYAKAVGREPNVPFMGDCLGDYTPENQMKKKRLSMSHSGYHSIDHDQVE